VIKGKPPRVLDIIAHHALATEASLPIGESDSVTARYPERLAAQRCPSGSEVMA